jgi:hypothetical protein
LIKSNCLTNLEKHNINYMQKILIRNKYKIILNTNHSIDIEYLIKYLSLDHLCKLFIDGSINFIIDNHKIKYFESDIIILYLLNMKKHNILYCNLILLDE